MMRMRNADRSQTGVGRGGFTLMELLVVVSIIALLIALTLPSIGKAKARAVSSTCMTRLHALGIAMQNYLSEFDDRYPINGIILPKSQVPSAYTSNPLFASAEQTNPDKWRIEYGALYRLMGGTEILPTDPVPLPPTPAQVAKAYLCPGDTLTRTNAETAYPNAALVLQPQPTGNPKVMPGPNSPGYWSYSVNSVLNSLGRFRNNFSSIPWNDPLRNASIRRPGQFITFVEEANESKFNDEVMDAPAYSNPNDPSGLVDRLTDRHNMGGNVFFADGHAEWFNYVAFNYVPTASGNDKHMNAMQSSITRMFFPDHGDFSATLAP